jgi:acetolactate synthase-1/2/3 large subunit
MINQNKYLVDDLIADWLEKNNIQNVFGIIGSANSYIFDSISKKGFTRIVYMHHEQSVVMAAGAYYRSSGKLSVAIVTAGAGASNAITGVLSNWADSIPCIVISGQESSFYFEKHSKLRMLGTQGFDVSEMVKNITKYSNIITNQELTFDTLEKAKNIAFSDRPGPVWIDIPFNIQSSNVDIPNWDMISFPEDKKSISSEYDQSLYEKTYEILKNAERPLVVGGNGVRLSKSNLLMQSFVEKHSIPFLLTWSAIDIIDNDHQLHFGRFGIYGQRCANYVIQNADVILVLGSRLALPQVGYDFSQFARNAKIIIVDVDANEVAKYEDRFDDIHIQSCDVFISNMLTYDAIGSKNNWIEYCNTLKQKYNLVDNSFQDDTFVNSYSFINKLSEKLADNHIITTDMGTALLSGHQAINLKKNQVMFTSLGLGEMGYGLPGAIGAAFACPDKPVLCLNCDGGIMMNLQEAHTIIDNNLNIKIVIFNNDGYLMIKHTQKMLFKNNFVGVNSKTGLTLPKFNLLMPAFGYKYYDLFDMQDFENTVTSFLSDPEPSVLEVYMNPEQDFIPKVKGVAKDDGSIFAPPIEEMSPLVSFDELKSNMIVSISEKSKQIVR